MTTFPTESSLFTVGYEDTPSFEPEQVCRLTD